MLGPLGGDWEGGGGELYEQVVRGGWLDKQVVWAGAGGTGRGEGGGARGSKGGDK